MSCPVGVKTRRAPSRHCRYARVYGHTTTAMHDIVSTPLHRQSIGVFFKVCVTCSIPLSGYRSRDAVAVAVVVAVVVVADVAVVVVALT